MYKVGLTLRFPRVERIREDRRDPMVLSELLRLNREGAGKLANRHYTQGEKN